MKILLTLCLMIAAVRADAACSYTGGNQNLCLPTVGDSANTWAAGVRANFQSISTNSLSMGTTMYFKDGKVGIGTTNPGAALDVAGTGIKASSITAAGHDILGAWYPWTPTWGGFSTNPTGTYRYRRVGKTITMFIGTTNAPISNSTALTMTLPDGCLSAWGGLTSLVVAQDNGGTYSTGVFYPAVGNNTANFYYSPAASTWTNANGKVVIGVVTVECQ